MKNVAHTILSLVIIFEIFRAYNNLKKSVVRVFSIAALVRMYIRNIKYYISVSSVNVIKNYIFISGSRTFNNYLVTFANGF